MREKSLSNEDFLSKDFFKTPPKKHIESVHEGKKSSKYELCEKLQPEKDIKNRQNPQ